MPTVTSCVGSKSSRPRVEPLLRSWVRKSRCPKTWIPRQGVCLWGFAQGWALACRTIQQLTRRNSIAPFNFPAMIPLWSIPLATVTGNTLILKPSERDPGAAMIIAELCKRAGAANLVSLRVYGLMGHRNRLARWCAERRPRHGPYGESDMRPPRHQSYQLRRR